MTVTGIISVIIIGLIIGVLVRLIAPGKQAIPIWLPILVVAAVGVSLAAWSVRPAPYPRLKPASL